MEASSPIHIRYANQRLILKGTHNTKDLQSRMNTIQWPQECVYCGGPVQEHDGFVETETFGFASTVAINVTGIPYCKACYAKVKKSRRIDTWRWVVAFLISAPVIYLWFSERVRNSLELWMVCRSAAIYMLLSYGLAWLIVKLPARHFMKSKILDPVKGELFEETEAGGDKVVSLGLSIPSKAYAAKFLDLNNQAPRETPAS